MITGAEGGIVSEGVAQVIDDLGNPRALKGDVAISSLFLLASDHCFPPGFVSFPNT
jgi:hypothetical protein